jgi:hypothetical protein
MRHVAWWLAIPVLCCAGWAQGLNWGSRDRITLPYKPVMLAQPRAERLFSRHVAYLLGRLPAGGVPDEQEYAIRSRTGTAFCFAVCLNFATCENPDDVRAAAIRLLAELTRTHVTGGGVTASGRAWGHHWQSAYWTWQATFAAWLLWPDVPPQLQDAIVAMAIDEADRFLELPPPYAEYVDSKAEENAWNAIRTPRVGASAPWNT